MGHVFEDLHNKIDMFTRQETKKKAVVSGLLFFLQAKIDDPFDPNPDANNTKKSLCPTDLIWPYTFTLGEQSFLLG